MKSYYAVIETGMGWLGILGSEAGLRRIILPQSSARQVLDVFGQELGDVLCDISPFGDLPRRLIRYFEGERVAFTDRVDLADYTAFQQAVWQITGSIPYGETRSYSWVAREIGIPGGARAVGQALGRNPLPLIVPCHRVIAKGNEPGGFSYGPEMKLRLLQIEAEGIY